MTRHPDHASQEAITPPDARMGNGMLSLTFLAYLLCDLSSLYAVQQEDLEVAVVMCIISIALLVAFIHGLGPAQTPKT